MPIFAETSDRYVEQDILARLDYTEDWSSFMELAEGDTITGSVWTAVPSDLVLSDAVIDGRSTSIWASGGVAGQVYRIANRITTAGGRQDVRYFHLSVADGAADPAFGLKTALFSRFTAIPQFKTSSVAFTSGTFPLDGIRDDDIWSMLVQAEAEVSHGLRVLFSPTLIVPETAPQYEIDALASSGVDYRLESPYDYDPATWTRDAWGFIKLKRSPVIKVESVRFTYPRPDDTIIEIPKDWYRVDMKFGHLQIVPTGTMMAIGPMYSYMMTAMSGGRIIPGMVNVRYTAGLANAAKDYPDLVGVVQRLAMLKLLKGGFLPQSGSISADGLSQSSSIDTAKWGDEIETEIEALRDVIHGPRMVFV